MSSDALALHEPACLLPRQYFACMEPERPHCEVTVYDLRCHKCRIAAQATLINSGDVLGIMREEDRGNGQASYLSKALTEATSRYGQ